MGAKWIDTWEGGRVREVDGRRVWVIERRIGAGERRVVTLGVHSLADARAELALFARDPLGYRSSRQVTAERAQRAARAVLDGDSLAAFAADAGKTCTPEYVQYVLGPYLSDWQKKLGTRDLGTVTLAELQRFLAAWPSARHKRIVALKSFTAWLREQGRLSRAVDPTLDLKVPQPKPEQAVRAKGYSMADVERVYAAVPSQLLRDTLCLRAKVGMHDTEIARVARGQALLTKVDDRCGIAGTVTFQHLKKGTEHTVSLDAQAFASAQRLQARGDPLTRAPALLMLKRLHRRLAGDACTCGPKFEHSDRCKGTPPIISPGELRHSFATWATQHGRLIRPTSAGLPADEVAAVMGHTNTRTTTGFYIGRGIVPPMIVIPLKLRHPADPLLALGSPRAARRKISRTSSGPA